MNLRDRLEQMKDATDVVRIDWLLDEMRKEGIGEPDRWIGTREAAVLLNLSEQAARNLASRCYRRKLRGEEPEIRVRKKGGTDRSHWEMLEADVHRKRRQAGEKLSPTAPVDEADAIADALWKRAG